MVLNHLYSLVARYPKSTITLVLGVTLYLAMQLTQLHWETDARVYLPKGHPAIKYDEKVDDVFGVKDSVIIGIVNEKDGIFNKATLARIARITDKVAALPGVIANRPIDVASLSTATIFVGTESSIGSEPLMSHVPENKADITRLKNTVYANSDLFVGNLISADGKAAMIRAKLKEGIDTRYKTYFQIKCQILPQETGDWSAMQECASAGGGGDWQKKNEAHSGGQSANGGQAGWQQGNSSWAQWQQGGNKQAGRKAAEGQAQNGDKIYLAGRPVIEVSSGMSAIKDDVAGGYSPHPLRYFQDGARCIAAIVRDGGGHYMDDGHNGPPGCAALHHFHYVAGYLGGRQHRRFNTFAKSIL